MQDTQVNCLLMFHSSPVLLLDGWFKTASIEMFSDEFATYLRYTRGLDFFEAPNYDYMRRLFSDLMSSSGWDFDWRFDWENRFAVSICLILILCIHFFYVFFLISLFQQL